VEGDASAATYFLAAGSIPGSGPVTVNGISKKSFQGDVRFTDLLVRMGASVDFSENSITACSPVDRAKLSSIDVDMNDMPDAAMTLAVLSLFADGESHIRNIANLRVKESERISGIRRELEKLGAIVKEDHDALHITPPEKIQFAKIDTYKDHRMAMAFSLAALGSDVVINDPGCVSKTFPEYFNVFLPLLKN
jgi:3-phosphoshikimate 1-carboxyvinyltransferase